MAANLDPVTKQLLGDVIATIRTWPGVVAVALGGSRSMDAADPLSDIDLYVYSDEEPDLGLRAALAQRNADRFEVGNTVWEPGDNWIERDSGIDVDIMYRSPAWTEEQLDRVLVHHQASVGYSTTLWHNVRTAVPLVDPKGWYGELQARASQLYPEPLRRAIVAKNHPILRDAISSYAHQIALAARRDDPVSVNHRVAALLGSYIDILFALNRLTHLGEKRLLAYVASTIMLQPEHFDRDVRELLAATAPPLDATRLHVAISRLIDPIDKLLADDGLIDSV